MVSQRRRRIRLFAAMKVPQAIPGRILIGSHLPALPELPVRPIAGNNLAGARLEAAISVG